MNLTEVFLVLKSSLLSRTLRFEVWERFCGYNMVDDLMIPAHRGKKGVIEWGPSSISHKVSVGSASKHFRKVGVQHSQGAVFTEGGQEGNTVWREH